jgi:aspartate ammonia-lyase
VIANIALEQLGCEKGRYDVLHPNTHVNMSQSTNDVFPTAISLTLNFKLSGLIEAIRRLAGVLAEKGKEFSDVVKIGRTELQDAVPMTLGQEFTAYSLQILENMHRLAEAQKLSLKMNLGATAIGTGINAHPEYARIVAGKLRSLSGIAMQTAADLVEATQDTGAYVQLSGTLKRLAIKLSKICNDLRLLSSGPRGGLNEINLPAVQPGSSIMPGKVNPVIPDAVNEVAFQVIGADVTVSMAAEAGQLEINAMEPIIAYNLFFSISILRKACHVLADRCVAQITANRKRCRELVERSIGLATALNPILGYETAARIARKAFETGRTIAEVVLEEGLVSQEELSDILKPERMAQPNYFHAKTRM